MIKLQTDNSLLLNEREKAKNYLLNDILKEHPLSLELVDDLINLTEVSLNGLEINEKTIALVYSRIYSPNLKNALPDYMVKETTNLKIVK